MARVIDLADMNRLILIFLILLIVSFGCGQGSSAATSNTTASGTLPLAHIDSISPGEATAGQRVAFQGHGTAQSGNVVAYNWRSSLDGDLNTLSEFGTPRLSVGEHIIYFKVQDSNGVWSEEDTKTINILNATPIDVGVTVTANPYKITQVEISGPAETVSCSFPLTLEFSGFITVDGPCTVYYQWEQDNGAVIPGQSIITYVPCKSSVTCSLAVASAGNYRIRLHTLTPNEMFSPYFFVTVSCDGVITEVVSTSVSTSGINDCPVTVYFSFSITMDGAGTVTYLWLRSDGIATPTYDLEFEAACTQTITCTWQIDDSLDAYWVRLHTLAPNVMETTNYLPVTPHCE